MKTIRPGARLRQCRNTLKYRDALRPGIRMLDEDRRLFYF